MNSSVLSAPEIFAGIERALGRPEPGPVVVCFDFFDTLVHRTVLPEETKKMAAEQLASQMGPDFGPDALYQVRNRLESVLCRENKRDGYDAEFNLATLAEVMHIRLRPFVADNSSGVSSASFIDRFLEIELNVEQSVQRLNDQVVEILKQCHEKGAVTAVISDFYLPKTLFARLLDHHGIAPFIDYLFVSADYLTSKGDSGRLYEIAAQELDCEPEQMHMIGDNPHADNRQAAARGLQTWLLETDSPGSVEVASGASVNELETVLQGNRASFFPEMGLALHWFTQRLFTTVVADGRDDLFFCSKEGEFLRKLFIRFQEQKFGRQVIRSHYVYVSRKATFICSLDPLEHETFDRLFRNYRDMSLTEFLQSLNFPEKLVASICGQLELDSSTRHFDLRNHPDFSVLLNAPVFRDWYERIRNEQRAGLLAYLDSFNVDRAGAGLTLVDVGWKGSIQDNIFFALGKDVEVHGYYLGLLSPKELRRSNRKTGILFHDVPAHSDYIHVFNNNRSLFEMMLGASHGSADGYYCREQAYPDGSGDHSCLVAIGDGQGALNVALLDLPEERALFSASIQPLQDVFYRLHEELTELSMSGSAGPMPLEWVARKYARMVFTPRESEVAFFAKLYHLENFGLFEFTEFDDTRSVSTVQKLKNLWALKKDPGAFLETGVWPPIILRRLGLGFLTTLDGRKRFKRMFGPGS